MKTLVEKFQKDVAIPSVELHDMDDCGAWYTVEADLMEKWLKEIDDFISLIRDDFDCDEDGHKHNTPCRVCEATKILDKE